MEAQKVAVVGGGPVGSTLSIILAQKGYEVDMFEKRWDPTPGSFKEEGRSFNLSVSMRALHGWKRANV
jgi:kynurenine 3-monooxygenase